MLDTNLHWGRCWIRILIKVNSGSGLALNQCLTNLLDIVGRLLLEPAEQEGEAAERAAAPSRQKAPRTRQVGSVCCRNQGNFLCCMPWFFVSRGFQKKNSRRKYKKSKVEMFFREKRTLLIKDLLEWYGWLFFISCLHTVPCIHEISVADGLV